MLPAALIEAAIRRLVVEKAITPVDWLACQCNQPAASARPQRLCLDLEGAVGVQKETNPMRGRCETERPLDERLLDALTAAGKLEVSGRGIETIEMATKEHEVLFGLPAQGLEQRELGPGLSEH